MRPSLSVAMIAPQGLQRQQLWLGGAVAHHAQCRIGLVGMISTPVINSAWPGWKSTGVELISMRLTWPCIPTISIS